MTRTDALPVPGHATGPWRRLAVQHRTDYDYAQPVEVAHHSAWLRPRDSARQRVDGWTLHIDPPPDAAVQQSVDAFGNWRHGFSHALVHRRLRVDSRFQVDVAPPALLRPQSSPRWTEVAEALRYRAGVAQPAAAEFALGSRFAPRHPAAAALAADCLRRPRQGDAGALPLLEAALALMERIHRRMAYAPLSTTVATDALQALAQGAGVCQDFAHLMLAALRSHGLAARYVSGYLLTQPPPGQPRLVGADASHAWVGVWCPANGWVDIDPTNNVVVGAEHVAVAWGRDYADVAPLRGVIRGGGHAAPQVAVSVEPIA